MARNMVKEKLTKIVKKFKNSNQIRHMDPHCFGSSFKKFYFKGKKDTIKKCEHWLEVIILRNFLNIWKVESWCCSCLSKHPWRDTSKIWNCTMFEICLTYMLGSGEGTDEIRWPHIDDRETGMNIYPFPISLL